MTDVQRDIGSLEARMDEHDKRFDRLDTQISKLDGKMDAGFTKISNRLDAINAAENRRKGALGLVKVAVGSGVLAGAWELFKGIFHK